MGAVGSIAGPCFLTELRSFMVKGAMGAFMVAVFVVFDSRGFLSYVNLRYSHVASNTFQLRLLRSCLG